MIIFTIFNFLLSIVSKFDLNVFSSLIESYGEGPIYSFGYSKFRSFGLIGQPGKNAIFCNFLVLGLIYIYKISKSKFSIILIILNGFSIILTLSRVGILIFIFIIIYNFLNIRNIKNNFFTIILIILSLSLLLLNVNQEFFDFNNFLRGFEGNNNFGTLGKRIYLKFWAFDTISQNFTSLLFGMGPSKEYVSSLTTFFANDLTLRHPDSSFTLWMLRYGF